MGPAKLIAFAVVAGLGVSTSPLSAETLPDKRPAMIGSGPGSLVNLIDAQGLFQKGQRDAWAMFSCVVLDDGIVYTAGNLRMSKGADLLQTEVFKVLRNARFIPAVYEHKRIASLFSGTAVFAVVKGKPHLRIFAHQEMGELRGNADLVAPQMVWSTTAKSFGWAKPGHATSTGIGGLVTVRHSVDATGKTTDLKILRESPANEGFGKGVSEGIRDSAFLPAYRNGKPTASTLTYEIRFGW